MDLALPVHAKRWRHPGDGRHRHVILCEELFTCSFNGVDIRGGTEWMYCHYSRNQYGSMRNWHRLP